MGDMRMRGMGALFAALGLVAVAVVVGSDLPAGARGVGFPPAGGNDNNNTRVNPQLFDAPLVELAAGAQTLAGPGTFFSGVDQGSLVYEVATGAAPDVCVTVRNLSTGLVHVIATGATAIEVELNRTRAACYAAPTQISLRCEASPCAAVWRVDRQ